MQPQTKQRFEGTPVNAGAPSKTVGVRKNLIAGNMASYADGAPNTGSVLT